MRTRRAAAPSSPEPIARCCTAIPSRCTPPIRPTGCWGATAELLAPPARLRPIAIVCDSDLMAATVAAQADEIGVRIPGDLAVVAWDDSPVCSLVRLAVTAFTHDIEAGGATASATADRGRPCRVGRPRSAPTDCPRQHLSRPAGGGRPGRRGRGPPHLLTRCQPGAGGVSSRAGRKAVQMLPHRREGAPRVPQGAPAAGRRPPVVPHVYWAS
ncbi:substrate-binding domain-containing protein [Mangrovactinospora gilvigrisea]|uniref:substrate-binding domain-containing protein n=1 Tax=Mangrovactinospora gilvigrisea TaxID=1428644 RepID=UPI0008FC38D0